MKVGIPCMKCSLNPSTQINRKTGKKSKTCGLGSAWRELNDERLGRDPTIDKSMTDLNVWMEGNSNDDVVAMVRQEIDEINEIRRSNGKRALRSDCVSVIAIVEKPNMDYMQYLSYEERKKFLLDSHKVMETLIHEWNSEWKILAAVQHHDEYGGLSAHNHTLVMLKTTDKDGLPNMQAKSEFNLKFFNFINKNYSLKMQDIGYDVENVKTYDLLSDEEKMERKMHPQEHGIDAYKYKKKKQEEMEQHLEQLKVKNNEMKIKLEETIVEITKAPNLQSYNEIKEENITLKEELSLKDRIIQKLSLEKDELKQNLEKWKSRCIQIANKIGNKMLNVIGINIDEVDIKKELPSKEVMQVIDDTSRTIKYNANDLRVIPDSQNKGKYCIILKKDKGYDIVDNNFDNRQLAEHRIKEIVDLKIEIDPIKETLKMNIDR